LSGAAKDDAVGLNGDFTFTIQDLLANDPGGAAKVNIDSQVLFGTTQEDWDDQEGYLSDHGITFGEVTDTYTVTDKATDFQYMVQIGNKGTWSIADVDVANDLLFFEGFDDYTLAPPAVGWEAVDLTEGGWATNAGGAATEVALDGYGYQANTIEGTSGDYCLDTQATDGPIDISHTFNDPTGGKVQLSFDIGSEYFNETFQTDSTDLFQFKIDDTVVDTISGAELEALGNNQLHHFEYVVDTGAAGQHTLTLTDLSPASNIGFAVDSVQINDWIV
jgi:hypothetical protein